MNLRHANPADAEPIAELHAASWRSTYAAVLNAAYLTHIVPSERRQLWAERLTSPKANQFVVVAEVQACIVGFACVFAENHSAWGAYLENLHVGATWQGKGVGRALLAEVAQWCESQSPGTGLYLSVNQDNRRAQGFYLRLGARNTEPGVWNAPEGSKVPTFWFTWSSVAPLLQAANPSIEGTSNSKLRLPLAAPHVER
jgi:ribosomal protein S18 acetylase RimI-like enzyme